MNVLFRSHCTDLPDGTLTIPGAEPVASTPGYLACLRTAVALCPPSQADGGRAGLVDLGCLEGGHSVAFARAGYDVLGIEVREENHRRCEWLRERVELENLKFMRMDVRDIPPDWRADVTFCAGLLYHLERPAEFLRQVARLTEHVLIVSTNYAPEDGCTSRWDWALGEMTENEGYRGRWFREHPEDVQAGQMEQAIYSSWSNRASFWLAHDHLLQAMRDAGFDAVYEQFDYVADIPAELPAFARHESIGLFVAVKVP